MKCETQLVRKPPTKYRFQVKMDTEMPQRKRGGQVLPTSVAVKPHREPSIQNMISHDRRPLAALSEPHIEPQIRRLYGHRSIGRDARSLPRTPIGCGFIATIFNLLRKSRRPTFRQSLHRNQLSCWRSISRHVSVFASHRLPCIPRSIGFVRSLTCVSSQEGVDTAA